MAAEIKMTTNKPGPGGPRHNPITGQLLTGRKPGDRPTVKKQYCIYQDQEPFLDGLDNKSEFVRAAIDEKIDKIKRPWDDPQEWRKV